MLDFRVHVVTWKGSTQSSFFNRQGSHPPADPFNLSLGSGYHFSEKTSKFVVHQLFGVFWFVWFLSLFCLIMGVFYCCLFWGFFCLVFVLDFCSFFFVWLWFFICLFCCLFFNFGWRRIGYGGHWFCLIVCFRGLNFCFLQLQSNW